MRNRGSGLTQLFRWGFPALLAGLLPSSARPCAAAETPHILAIKAGRILTVTKGTIENGVILIQNGKIVALGRQGEVTIPAGAEVIDASSEWVMPGQVDLHVHIGTQRVELLRALQRRTGLGQRAAGADGFSHRLHHGGEVS